MVVNKLKFGLSAIQAGQKSSVANAEPRLIVNSTLGKFQLTSPVTKAMHLAVGEYVQFLNNIENLEVAISEGNQEIFDWAAENGVDLNTREGKDIAIKELTAWAIVKGVEKRDIKNNPVFVTERFTEKDKLAYIQAHGAEILAENRELLIERNNGEDADDETLISLITPEDIASPKVKGFTGSRATTTSNATGVGCMVSFTDTFTWNTLKADLGDDKTSKNRVFRVLVDSPVEAKVNNGYEEVDVIAFPIEFESDNDPIVRGAKD